MNWIYHYKREWINEGSSPVQSLFLRPVKLSEDGQKMVGKIVDLDVVAIEYFMKEEFKDIQKDNSFGEIYFKELATKDYHFVETDVSESDLYLLRAIIYVKDEELTPESLFEWVKAYFSIKGVLFDKFEETSFDDFVDTNPLFRMMTEGAKKMESEWGKEWWKNEEEE